jgi:hypothetical protein
MAEDPRGRLLDSQGPRVREGIEKIPEALALEYTFEIAVEIRDDGQAVAALKLDQERPVAAEIEAATFQETFHQNLLEMGFPRSQSL